VTVQCSPLDPRRPPTKRSSKEQEGARTLGPMVTLTASARSLTPCSMAARAPTPNATSFTAYPRAQSRCCSPPLPRASCFRSAEEDLEMAAAAARYMVASRACAFLRRIVCVLLRVSFWRMDGGRGFMCEKGLGSGSFGSTARSSIHRAETD
jgi:hypothetical protein